MAEASGAWIVSEMVMVFEVGSMPSSVGESCVPAEVVVTQIVDPSATMFVAGLGSGIVAKSCRLSASTRVIDADPGEDCAAHTEPEPKPTAAPGESSRIRATGEKSEPSSTSSLPSSNHRSAW